MKFEFCVFYSQERPC